MSTGLPVIASNIPGSRDVLDNFKSFLFEPGDYKELSKQIKNYSIEKEKLLLMADENFTKAKEYTKLILDSRRSEFLKNFRDSI